MPFVRLIHLLAFIGLGEPCIGALVSLYPSRDFGLGEHTSLTFGPSGQSGLVLSREVFIDPAQSSLESGVFLAMTSISTSGRAEMCTLRQFGGTFTIVGPGSCPDSDWFTGSIYPYIYNEIGRKGNPFSSGVVQSENEVFAPLRILESDGYHYGWAQLDMGGITPQDQMTVRVSSIHYESIAGQSVIAAAIPEPSAAALTVIHLLIRLFRRDRLTVVPGVTISSLELRSGLR